MTRRKRTPRDNGQRAIAALDLFERWTLLPHVLVVFCVVVVAFFPALSAGFVNFDDDRLLLHNPYLALPWPSRLAWMWSTTHMGHYQPLTWLTLSIDRAIGGLRPFVFHADSVLLHGLASVALFFLILEVLRLDPASPQAPGRDERQRPDRDRMSVLLWSATAGALFWAIHPLRVESVAWIAERRDPLSALFWLLAVFAYVRAARTSGAKERSRAWFNASVLFFVLSVLSKAWGMTLFLILIALDVYPLGRLPAASSAVTDLRYRRVWLEKLPFAVGGVLTGAVAWLAQRGSPDTMVSLQQWTFSSRILQAVYGLAFYLRKTIWPTRLAALYELPHQLAAASMPFLASLAIVATAAIGIAWSFGRLPGLAVAVFSYFVIVAPVLGIAQSGPQLVADRYAYLSTVPFSVLIAAGLAAAFHRAARAAAMCTVILLAALGAMTWRQTSVWHDSLSLWSHALAVGHPSSVAHLDYGQALRAAGQTDHAISEYRQALALRPESGNAWYNLGNALKSKGDEAGAEQAYLQAIDHLTWKVDAQVNLGNLYYNRRDLERAIEQYRAATAALDHAGPSEFAPEPYLYLGMALGDRGDREDARRALAVARRYPATRMRAEAELQRLR